MHFRVGKFTCEMSIGGDGTVEARWFLSNGHRIEPPKYLGAADRREYRAQRDAFLACSGKLPARLGPQASASWRALRRLAVVAVAASLAGCARGGGIGLEAIVADGLCEQQGFHLGTPEYANCRAQIAYQRGMVNAQMQAYYQRQQDYYMQQLNRQQTCSYNGSTIGGITNGTMSCRVRTA